MLVILAEKAADLNPGVIWDLSGFGIMLGLFPLQPVLVVFSVWCSILIMCEVDLYDLRGVRVQIKEVTPLNM